MGWRTTFANLTQGNEPLSLFDQQNDDVGLLTIVPCTATGTNTIALAPNGYCATQSVYANYQAYGFVAANTSTGAVTLNVNSIGALNLYQPNGTLQVGAGQIVAGQFYLAAYNSALNSSAGGFQLIAPTYAQGSWTPADASGGSLTFTSIVATYQMNGNLLTASFAFTYPSTADTNPAKISGLPFNTASAAYGKAAAIISPLQIASSAPLTVVTAPGAETLTFDLAGNAVLNATMSTRTVNGTITYPLF